MAEKWFVVAKWFGFSDCARTYISILLAACLTCRHLSSPHVPLITTLNVTFLGYQEGFFLKQSCGTVVIIYGDRR